MFEIRLTPEAIDDLRRYPKPDRKRIVDEVEGCLRHEPGRETKNNKKLRPNRLAERELRAGGFRVFYDLDADEAFVKIVAIGHKSGSRLFVRGEEFQL
jgi:mRNA-degrading endonuclease RelE of RelBE toxin-antitoxin system